MVAVAAIADSKPYVEPDPLIGYRYIPNTRLSLQRPGGGRYEMVINAAGIRSDREFGFNKPPNVTRIIVCGDSMAAGQFVSNDQRFSELLERRHRGLEVLNIALEGSGTDQQVLLYEHVGLRYEHDAVVLLPFLQNIRRNLVGARDAIDPATGAPIRRAKPRFELKGDGLVLWPPDTAEAAVMDTDAPQTRTVRLKSAISRLPGASLAKAVAFAIVPWEPFPEYRDPANSGWQLMAALVQRLKTLAGARPLVVAPVFYSNYVRYRMAMNYWDRFSSLAGTPGIFPVNVLPHFRRLGPDAVRCFQDPHDMHFSPDGHLVLAEAMEAELGKLGLLGAP